MLTCLSAWEVSWVMLLLINHRQALTVSKCTSLFIRNIETFINWRKLLMDRSTSVLRRDRMSMMNLECIFFSKTHRKYDYESFISRSCIEVELIELRSWAAFWVEQISRDENKLFCINLYLQFKWFDFSLESWRSDFNNYTSCPISIVLRKLLLFSVLFACTEIHVAR